MINKSNKVPSLQTDNGVLAYKLVIDEIDKNHVEFLNVLVFYPCTIKEIHWNMYFVLN
jgi:hypothetical protein